MSNSAGIFPKVNCDVHAPSVSGHESGAMHAGAMSTDTPPEETHLLTYLAPAGGSWGHRNGPIRARPRNVRRRKQRGDPGGGCRDGLQQNWSYNKRPSTSVVHKHDIRRSLFLEGFNQAEPTKLASRTLRSSSHSSVLEGSSQNCGRTRDRPNKGFPCPSQGAGLHAGVSHALGAPQ